MLTGLFILAGDGRGDGKQRFGDHPLILRHVNYYVHKHNQIPPKNQHFPKKLSTG